MASTVTPMTMSGILRMHPMRPHHSTMNQEMAPIQQMDMVNVSKYHLRVR